MYLAMAISYASRGGQGKRVTAYACGCVVSRVDRGRAARDRALELPGLAAAAPAFQLPVPPHRRAGRHAGAARRLLRGGAPPRARGPQEPRLRPAAAAVRARGTP